MTDIVERLRAHKVPQMHEAAAEIERLRDEVERLRDEVERLRDEVERLSNANDQVWADNERLRAALLKIKRGSVWNCDIEAFIDAALAEEKKDDL
jgi:predicted RNase H-like nuclease (RuvC/YqgF family)